MFEEVSTGSGASVIVRAVVSKCIANNESRAAIPAREIKDRI